MTSGPRIPLGLAAWLACVSLGTAGPSGSDLVERLGTLGTAAPPAELAPDEVEEAVEILLAGVLPDGAGSLRALAVAQRTFLLEALDAAVGQRVCRSVLERIDGGSPPTARRTALEILGRCGSERELDELVQLARPAGDAASFLDHELERALGGVLARDARARARVADRLDDAHDPLRGVWLGALGASGSRAGLAVLERLLYIGDPHLEQVLQAISQASGTLSGPFEDSLVESVARVLDADGPAGEAALRAAGALRDRRLVEGLVEAIDARSSVRKRSAARRALIDITGCSFGFEPEKWQEWYESERAWWEGRWPERHAALLGGDAAEIVPALAEAAQHPLFGEELAVDLVPLLDHDSAVVRSLTCTCLGRLGAHSRLQDLVSMLTDPDEGVIRAAAAALEQLTGLDRPPRPSDWEEELDPR